ncbi:MAG: O-antigen ligase family protein [Phormidesmis sp.]
MSLFKTTMIIALFISATADLSRGMKLGPLSALALFTIALALVTWLMIAIKGRIPKAAQPALGLIAFVIFTILSLIGHLSNSEVSPIVGLQNISVYIAFVGILILSCVESTRSFNIPDYVEKYLPMVTLFSAGLFWIGSLTTALGAGGLVGSRAYALFSISGVAWLLASWRYGKPRSLLYSGLVIITIVSSLSRMVSVICVLLAVISQTSLSSFKGLFKTLFILASLAMVSYAAFTFIPSVNARFTGVGDNATVGGVQVDTAGRSKIWGVVYASAMKAPLLGQGPGSVTIPVAKETNSIHPHNDYLRFFYDYGLAGVVLWIWGYSALLVKTFSNWIWANTHDRANAHTHLAAFLALIGVAVGMITDNVVVYVFAMSPLGVLVGASLGSGYRRRQYVKSAASRQISHRNGLYAGVSKPQLG